jgi:hypothetical protein
VLNFNGPSRRKAGNADYLAQARLNPTAAPTHPPKQKWTGISALFPSERPPEGRKPLPNLLEQAQQARTRGLPDAD